MRRVLRRLSLAIPLLGLCVAAVACGKAAEIPTVAVEARDFSFALPASIPGGLTRFDMKNAGDDSHHMQLLKLNDGISPDQFQSTLEGALQAVPTEGEAALFRIFEVATLAGGPSGTAPGNEASAILDIAPGNYALVCFIAGADGIPHLAKGMVQPLSVTAAPAEAPAAPKETAAVALRDFGFSGAPVTLKPGKTTLKVTNEGQEPHEMVVLKLKGVTADQALAAMMTPPGEAPAGPPPFEDAGGFQAIMPGSSGWVELDLAAGDYALVCFIPSPANEFAPHVALGMLSSIKVN